MPASPSTARAINDRLALRLLQQEGPLTAGQLKQLTGLSRPSVADLVERLAAAGLIDVVGESGEQRRGPNAKLYGIVADQAHLAALDVRTEGVSVVVSDLLGRVLAEASVPIGGDTGTGPAVEQAVALVERAAKEAGVSQLHTVGIGAPGLIDPATGELRDSSGLPAWHRRLVATLQERLPEARVHVENETNLAALAEQREGVARDRDTFVLLWLGLGTGAAVVLDGTLRRGASGGTGEIGFLPVPGTAGLPSAVDCEGGFHSLAGSAAIVELAARHGLMAETNGSEPPAASVVREAVAGVGRVAAGMDRGADPGVGRETVAGRGRGAVAGVNRQAVAGADQGTVAEVSREAVVGADQETGVGVDRGAVAAVNRQAVAGADQEAVAEVSREAVVGGDQGAGAGVDREAVAGVNRQAVVSADQETGIGVGRGAVAEVNRQAVVGVNRQAVAGVGREMVGEGRETAAGVRREVVSGGAVADFLDALADRLAVGVAAVVAVLDPGCLVLAGEVGRAGGADLAARVERRVRRMSPLPTEVRASALGGEAVLRGALLTARDRAQDELFAPR